MQLDRCFSSGGHPKQAPPIDPDQINPLNKSGHDWKFPIVAALFARQHVGYMIPQTWNKIPTMNKPKIMMIGDTFFFN
ncbi:hypothetical protein, partial [Lacticaseibacillus baoqingensis]|uniref:hypothetical protein n=1 Tax=Lacticaseibacillus baoqingensis TaxID=2486013 RepID=UPI001CDC11ED